MTLLFVFLLADELLEAAGAEPEVGAAAADDFFDFEAEGDDEGDAPVCTVPEWPPVPV